MAKILVVDDEASIVTMLAYNLKKRAMMLLQQKTAKLPLKNLKVKNLIYCYLIL